MQQIDYMKMHYRTVLDVLKLVDSHVLVVERMNILQCWTREQEARC